LISDISKKVIFSSLFFINIFQISKSAENPPIINGFINRNSQLRWSNVSNEEIPSNSSNIPSSKDFVKNIADEKFLKKSVEPYFVANREKQRELIIQADKQSEINDVIYAEGNVSVSYRGKLLKADSLIYDKLNKKINAKGNITLELRDQFFKVSQLEYSFISEKGYLLDVEGSINTDKLMDDLSSNFSLSDSKKLESLLELEKKEVINTPNKVHNWLFFTDKMTIDGESWKSKKAIFSNDLLELKQLKLAINSLEIFPSNEELRFKSTLNYLILEDKISIPFWLGNRKFDLDEPSNRWTLGYENLDKDGYFIGRKLNSIDIDDDFVINLEPQFLIQRSLKGYTNSFVKKGESITSKKVRRNANFDDYFALKSQVKGRINNWDLEIDKNLNSFDFDKFSDAFRLKTKLNKEISFLNTKWDKSFYGVYRDRVWNGSLGESEIYVGYGSKLEKRNSWRVNGISKSEKLSIGFGNFKGKALKSKNLVNSIKGNVFYSLNQKFPVFVAYPPNNFVDSSFRYIPKPVTKGLKFDTKLELYSSIYKNAQNQNYIGFGAGPEVTFGNFKNKYFDYTRIRLRPFYKLIIGDESPFKFDNVADKFILDISFDQQIYGPIVLKSKGILNLDSDSDDYGEFIKSSISLNWKRRSYEVGIYYQPYNETGGIAFTLFGFK